MDLDEHALTATDATGSTAACCVARADNAVIVIVIVIIITFACVGKVDGFRGDGDVTQTPLGKGGNGQAGRV